jgi:uroporphyrinogen decarboxylase
MNNRDWVLQTLRHETGSAVPYNFLFSPVSQRHAEKRYGAPLAETLNLPLRMGGLASIKPLYADPTVFGPTAKDEYGVVWSTSPIDRGQPIGPCLKEPTLKGYRFPDPLAEYRYKDIGSWCVQNAAHYRILWVGDLWERVTFMRGMEAALLDVALHPAFLEELLDGIQNFILQAMQILFARYAFDAIAVSDDYGTQKALVMSPADWRRLVKPRLGKIYEFAKRRGRAVFHHTCGYVVPLIGDLIDIGLDILHPIQPETMDLSALKRDFGRRLTFCGGVRTQDLLVRATPDEIRREVRRLKRDLGTGGGYILEPGITLQADVPPANLFALIDEARQPGLG